MNCGLPTAEAESVKMHYTSVHSYPVFYTG